MQTYTSWYERYELHAKRIFITKIVPLLPHKPRFNSSVFDASTQVGSIKVVDRCSIDVFQVVITKGRYSDFSKTNLSSI